MPTRKETRAAELRRIRWQRSLQLEAVVRFCVLNDLSRADLERMVQAPIDVLTSESI